DVQLTPSVLELDAVVVTGTAGVARVRELGNTVARVNLAEVKDPPANLDQLLQARTPGLSVMQTSGMAGEGAQIRLRGAVSVSQIFTKHGSSGAPRWTFETGQGFARLRPFGTDSVPYLNLRPAGAVNGQCHASPVLGCSWIRDAYRQRYSGSVSGGVSGAAGF